MHLKLLFVDYVTSIEIGDFDRGYRKIDIQETASQLYSLARPLYVGLFIVAIPSTQTANRISSRRRRLATAASTGELPTIPVDDRAAEVRAIKVG